MILYLDTSAVVKLYVQEAGTRDVKKWVRASEGVATSIVAYAETRAAFARLLRENLTVSERHEERLGRFNADWDSYARVELGHSLARTAGELAEVYGLRGFDSIHLASALWLHDAAAGHLQFAAFDARLLGAATRAGLKILEPR